MSSRSPKIKEIWSFDFKLLLLEVKNDLNRVVFQVYGQRNTSKPDVNLSIHREGALAQLPILSLGSKSDQVPSSKAQAVDCIDQLIMVAGVRFQKYLPLHIVTFGGNTFNSVYAYQCIPDHPHLVQRGFPLSVFLRRDARETAEGPAQCAGLAKADLESDLRER